MLLVYRSESPAWSYDFLARSQSTRVGDFLDMLLLEIIGKVLGGLLDNNSTLNLQSAKSSGNPHSTHSAQHAILQSLCAQGIAGQCWT